MSAADRPDLETIPPGMVACGPCAGTGLDNDRYSGLACRDCKGQGYVAAVAPPPLAPSPHVMDPREKYQRDVVAYSYAHTIKDAAVKFRLGDTTIAKWRKLFPRPTYAELEAEIARLNAAAMLAEGARKTLRARMADKPGVIGATIILHGGGYFDFIAPEKSSIRILDIARGLSNTCRFGGQASRGDGFYSVAQHSVLVSELVEPAQAFAALMHDAAEAYIGDMVGPLKQLCPDFKAIERRVEAAVFARFRIATPLDPSIKHADLRALRTEQRDLTSGSADNWNGLDDFPPDPRRIVPLAPDAACSAFLLKFIELCPWDASSMLPAPPLSGGA